MTTSRRSLAALFVVAAVIAVMATRFLSGSTAHLEQQIQELTASVASLQEQNSRLNEQNSKLEQIKAELKRLVCDSTNTQALASPSVTQSPVPPTPVPATPVPTAMPQTSTPAVRESLVEQPPPNNPAANMNAQPVEEPIHFPFDLPAERQRQVDDLMLRHNTENLTEFQERFAGRQPEPVELAQFAKERKEKLLQNLRGVLDDEQFRQAEAMLLQEKH